ncbi:unnamed protein product [Candidula unifasciata]|uniref:Pyridoxal phosphate homeostasis protein n=1 Tax=Candidula unifasciata TaxID=100452 RepID=A0A8S3YR78_9EUPU|nr:unnamed protein product [Candidula unifasciata]
MSTAGFSIARQIKLVLDKMEAAALRRPESLQYAKPRLVAVSKTKSVDMIIEAYDAGQRHFGENYVVELYDKASDFELQDRCRDIRWHFIGHLQRNKVSKLLDVPNLFVVETVDSIRLAKAINETWQRLNKIDPLNVMAQVNTSGEESKSGCAPEEVVQLVKYIKEECPRISLVGLMTIGSFDHDPSTGPNPDFQALFKARENVCKELDMRPQDLDLSMGMSNDFEHAIEMGSTSVRVGSTIFGSRSAPETSHEHKETELHASA